MKDKRNFPYLIRLDVPLPERRVTDPALSAKHNIWVLDFSGSMSPHLRELAEDVCGFVDTALGQRDLLTILWFSSEGLHGTLVKGARKQDADLIKKMVRDQAHARALTCFSESLQDAANAVDDLAVFGLPVSLMFFSDGYPVVRDVILEQSKAVSIMEALKPRVGQAVLVGYGPYYNRDLMNRMAESIGGSLVHASDLGDFGSVMVALAGKPAAKRITVRLPVKGVTHVIGLSGVAPASYAIDGNGEVSAPEYERALWAYVPDTVDDRRVRDLIEEQEKSEGAIAGRARIGAAYAVAAQLGREGNLRGALHVLGQLGDVRLVNEFANAFSNEEIGLVLNEADRAAVDEELRFTEGRKPGCLPKDDALCLVEVLEWLSGDEEVRFHPGLGFSYKRTGVRSKVKGDYPPFNRADSGVPVKLVWNSERLNVNMQVTYTGTVEIGQNELGLPNPYPCVQYRTYTMIKDGTRWIDSAWFSLSKATFLALQAGGLIKKNVSWVKDKPVLLDFRGRRLPVMNRSMGQSISAKILADLTLSELCLEAEGKVLRWVRSILDPEKEQGERRLPLTAEQIVYLANYGINGRGEYAPPTEDVEPTDHYEATTFVAKIVGGSSLPKISEVEAKLTKGGKLTLSQSLLAGALEYTSTFKDDLEAVDRALRGNREILAITRNQINRYRIALVLGHHWFVDLERDKTTFTAHHRSYEATVKFEFDRIKVSY